MTQLCEALGAPKTIEFAGRAWSVRPMTFNDLCDLEDRFGDVANIDLSRVAGQRFVLWVILRGETGLTEREVGELLTIDQPEAVGEFIGEVLRMSGLTRDLDDPADAPKNAAAPAGRAKRSTGAS